MLYAMATLSAYKLSMIVPSPLLQFRRSAIATVALCGLGCGLGGCASVGDSFASSAFVDPAKYDQYDCKQLENERKGLAARTVDLQRLIDKAETGAGGAVVGELVYRNDYISARASAKLVEDTWRSNKCVETPPAVAAPGLAVPTPPPKGARKRSGAG